MRSGRIGGGGSDGFQGLSKVVSVVCTNLVATRGRPTRDGRANGRSLVGKVIQPVNQLKENHRYWLTLNFVFSLFFVTKYKGFMTLNKDEEFQCI